MGAFAQVPLSFESPDPVKSYGQTLNLREAMLNTQLRQQQVQNEQMKNQEAKLQLQDQTVLRNAWQQANGDPRKLPSLVQGKVSPQTMMKLNQEVTQWQKSNLDLGEAQIKQNKDRAERTAQIAGSITDEDSLRNGLKMAQQEKLIDNETAQGLLTKGWTPETQAAIKQYQQQGATYSQLHTAALDDIRGQVETGKLNEDRLKNAGTVLGAATTQADYAKTFYSDAVHPSVRSQFDAPEDFSEESPNKARRYGMSADQQLKAPAEAAKTQQEQLSYAGGRLSAAPTQASYAGIYYSQPPEVRKNFAEPKDWTPEIGKAQARIGLNAEQEVRAQQADERINMRRNQPNAQQEKELVSHLANIALQDSIAGGGRRMGPEAYDDAVKNLRTFYKNSPDMQRYQEDVVDLLNKRKSTAGTADLKGDKLADEESVRQLIYGNQKKPGGAPTAPATAPPTAGNPDQETIKGKIRQQATKQGVDAGQLLGLAESESGFDQSKTSKTGARGVFQFTQGTAKDMGIDRENVDQNIEGGVRYWKKLLTENGGDVAKATAAFKGVSVGGATPADVAKAQKLMETHGYQPATPAGKPSALGTQVASAQPPKQQDLSPQIVGNGLTVKLKDKSGKDRFFPFASESQMDGFLKEIGYSRTKK